MLRSDPSFFLDCFHVQGVSKNKGDVVFDAKISYPVPAEHAFNANDDIFQIGENDFKEFFSIRLNVTVNDCFTFLVQDADVHFSCMKIDAAVVLVLLIVKSHFGLLFRKSEWNNTWGSIIFLIPYVFREGNYWGKVTVLEWASNCSSEHDMFS